MNAAMLHVVSSDATVTLADVPPTVLKILRGTLAEIAARGTRRLTMSDISERSGVSRGTLYRYFSTKGDVIAAVSEYVSVTFEHGVRAVAAQHLDPVDRLRAVMRYHATFTGEQTPEQILVVEPAFMLGFFRSHFARHKAALLDALAPAFDGFEARLGYRLNREAIVETMIRVQLSRLLVPAAAAFAATWDTVPDTFLNGIGLLLPHAEAS